MIKKTEINYVVGDATSPQGDGHKFVVHCCNTVGGWGAGFVLALSKKWKAPEEQYRIWFKNNDTENPFELGNFQIVPVDTDNNIYVVNLIGQEGVGVRSGRIPIRYEAFEKGFFELSKIIVNSPNGSVHMPRIGCGLAGGKWEKVEPIILETFCEFGIPVTVYDF